VEDSAFSDAFCRFLQATVPSVEAAELLLLLAKQPETRWEARQAVEALKKSVTISEAEAARFFELFQARSVVTGGPDKRFQYRAATRELEEHVAMLARAYNERPVTLIRVIYGLRDAKIQSFADAFRLKKG